MTSFTFSDPNVYFQKIGAIFVLLALAEKVSELEAYTYMYVTRIVGNDVYFNVTVIENMSIFSLIFVKNSKIGPKFYLCENFRPFSQP